MSVDSSILRWTKDGDSIVTITMDDPAQSANTMTPGFTAELSAIVDRLYLEKDDIRGVVITSAKKSFFAGGDLNDLVAATPADAPRFTQWISATKNDLRRLEVLGKPVVAAINGPALGGGLELALACHRRIALAPHAQVGLPEVTLGLLPGAGGTIRTVRMLGLRKALFEVLLTGRRFDAVDAAALGLVDEVVSTREELLAHARDWILADPQPLQPWDRPGFEIPGGNPGDVRLAPDLFALPSLVRRSTHGAPAPAARAIMAVAVEGAQLGFDSAQVVETRYAVSLICGQVSTNLIQSTFFDLQAINRGDARPAGIAPFVPGKVAVLGAGMMGSGIAYVCAKAGLSVVLKDVSQEAADKGKQHCERLLDSAVERGRMSAQGRDDVLSRIRATADPADADGANVLVEAVFEDPDLKIATLREMAPYLAADALIATNTSTLPISMLADGAPRPEAFIGLHFFSPVDKMALLEVVVGRATNDETIAKAVDFARVIGKSPILVNDSRGFFTSRVIVRYVNEALSMVEEGVAPITVERAAIQVGYPVGPLALLDEISLTLTRRIRDETIDAVVGEGLPAPQYPGSGVVDRMIDEFGRAGRSAGSGFYDYSGGRRGGLWAGLSAFNRGTSTPFADLQERMLFSEAVDAVRCLDEGVLRSVADANVGSLLGIGFPSWTGGVLQYINQYQGGPAGFVVRCNELAESYGDRFLPPASLTQLARAGGTYR